MTIRHHGGRRTAICVASGPGTRQFPLLGGNCDASGSKSVGPEGPPTQAARVWAYCLGERDFSSDAFVSAATNIRRVRIEKHRARRPSRCDHFGPASCFAVPYGQPSSVPRLIQSSSMRR
ncbi:DUF6053 domain-containing protein [Lysobacter enzymogenes]|uniref:DUF6053 domain-containing protein n=1 Tax=Lysobacter enzymogenes TaxID=69 RepID=UPI0037483F46